MAVTFTLAVVVPCQSIMAKTRSPVDDFSDEKEARNRRKRARVLSSLGLGVSGRGGSDLRTCDVCPRRCRCGSATVVDSRPFPYINWLDDGFVRGDASAAAASWAEFVRNIGATKLRRLPLVQQAKFDCSVAAAVTSWEVQHDERFPLDLTDIPAHETTKEKGARLAHQVPRVWGRSARAGQPKLLTAHAARITPGRLMERLRTEGPVYLGLGELGYPWANDAQAGEKLQPPRFDPYNNPWDATRRTGADGHAICIVGCLHTRDLAVDAVRGGHPARNPKKPLGNCFVTKCTNLPAGWNGASFAVDGVVPGESLRPEHVCYALLPADLLTAVTQSGGESRRVIDDGFVVPMQQAALGGAGGGDA